MGENVSMVGNRGQTVLRPDPSFRMTEQQRAATALLAGPQRNSLLVGGARSQKTFTIVRAIMTRALKSSCSRHAILRFRNNSIWPSIAMDTIPKVRKLCFPALRLEEHKQMGYFGLPNGSEIWLGGLDDGERVEKILGNEYATIYFNESSQIPYPSVLTALTRLAQVCPGLAQRAYYDLNPTGMGHYTYKMFYELRDPATGRPLADPENYKKFEMSPKGNLANLTKDYLSMLENMPERQKRRFYDGIYAAEAENALWTYELIDKHRRTPDQVPPLQSIAVCVDPSGAASESDFGHDPIGIAVVGLGIDGHGYLLADLTMLGSPAQWGRMAVQGYLGSWCESLGMEHVLADRIVGETNFGGAMVHHVINTAAESLDVTVPYREVNASRGKVVRAEPVSAIYETGKFHHVGRFPDLEDELCLFTNLGYTGARSPNRADALIWGAHSLKLCDEAAAWLNTMRSDQNKRNKIQAGTGRPVPVDDGGLMDAYKKAYSGGLPEPTRCARDGCTEALGGDRVTDGVQVWHPRCYSGGMVHMLPVHGESVQ